jgi:hypothetical protein
LQADRLVSARQDYNSPIADICANRPDAGLLGSASRH